MADPSFPRPSCRYRIGTIQPKIPLATPAVSE
jgi:hypothetical protein